MLLKQFEHKDLAIKRYGRRESEKDFVRQYLLTFAVWKLEFVYFRTVQTFPFLCSAISLILISVVIICSEIVLRVWTSEIFFKLANNVRNYKLCAMSIGHINTRIARRIINCQESWCLLDIRLVGFQINFRKSCTVFLSLCWIIFDRNETSHFQLMI